MKNEKLKDNINNWEKEFEKQFIKQGDYGDLPIPPMLVMRFIRALLAQARQQSREELLNEIWNITENKKGYDESEAVYNKVWEMILDLQKK